jgi:hypothetical protein
MRQTSSPGSSRMARLVPVQSEVEAPAFLRQHTSDRLIELRHAVSQVKTTDCKRAIHAASLHWAGPATGPDRPVLVLAPVPGT